MNRKMALTIATVLALASCTDPTGVAESEGIRVEVQPFGLSIQNRGDAEVYYFAIDQDAAALVTWVGCGSVPVADPEVECGPGIRPGEKQSVPSDQIYAWGESGRVIVFWWHLVPGEGGYGQGSMRSVVVDH